MHVVFQVKTLSPPLIPFLPTPVNHKPNVVMCIFTTKPFIKTNKLYLTHIVTTLSELLQSKPVM